MRKRSTLRASTAWPRRLHSLPVGLLGAILVMAGCGPAQGQTGTLQTAEFTLVASKTEANGGFNFNGYMKGELAITVPVHWKVVIHYKNGGALRHSFDVIPFAGTQPDKAPDPAFGGAATKDLTDGIGVGKEETISFVAEEAGKYEFLCGVLGHAQAGMWDYLIVSPTAKAPSAEPPAAVEIMTK